MFLRLRGTVAVVAVAFAVPLVVLLASVRTSVGFWDTGDLQTVAWIAGIPYPTGFPGYVLLGWLWTHVLPFGSVAARLNALSAVAVAAGAATVTALALAFEVLPLIAILGGWTFAFAHTIWTRASYADVHPVGFAVAFAALALAVRWSVKADARALVAGIVLAGAALAIDNTTVLILAGLPIAALARRMPVRPVALAALGAVAIVAVAYAYLPLRSAQVTAARLDPTLALGIEPGRPFWDDHDPRTREGFVELVTGAEWSPGHTLGRLFTPAAIGKAEARLAPDVAHDFPQGLLVVAVIGLAFVAAADAVLALALVLAAVIPAVFGGSYQAEADPHRYVFALYAVAALGIAISADRAARAFGRETPTIALGAVAGLLAAVLVADAVQARDIFERRGERDAAELGARVAASTRDGAVVVAIWDFATPLAYRAYVERDLGSRIVVVARPPDHLLEYRDWMRDHQVTIVSDGAPNLPGYRTRLLAEGDPQVYEILPP